MKKVFTLVAFLFVGLLSLSAQAQESQALHRPGLGNQMRDLQNVLTLDRDQMQIMKDYYTLSSRNERLELADVTTPFQRAQIKRRYQTERDNKIRSILKEEQLPIFEAYLVDRAENGPGIEPGATLEGGGGQ